MSHIEFRPGGGATYAGPDAVAVFRARAVASALRLYARTGLKANRAYTPSAMLAVATEVTGRKFKRGQYAEAAAALDAWAIAAAQPLLAPTRSKR